jgi:hypothetical protein
MPALRILLSDDPTDPDFIEAREHLKGREVVRGEISTIGALPRGMASGRTSIYVQVELADGRVAFCETSLALLQMATAAFTGRYGHES